MTSARAILIGSAIIAGSVIAVGASHSAIALVGGPFQLGSHYNATALPGVFRLDVSTGEVSYCHIDANAASVVCVKAMH